MAIVFDAQADLGSFTTTSPDDTTYTPVGTPRGILVGISQGPDSSGVSADHITSVSYGGVAMARVATVAQLTGTEAGRVYLYFLGASIPTGAQTVSIVHDGTAFVKWAAAWSVTAAADTEIGDFDSTAFIGANPQLALDTGAVDSLRFAILFTGANATSGVTALTDVLAVGSSPTFDFGNQVTVAGRQSNTAVSGSQVIGYTIVSQSQALVAAAVQEVSAGTQALTGALFTKAPTFFTGTVTPGAVALTGTLFTKAPTFFTGVVTARYNLTGVLFTKAPTFPQGALTTGAVALTGTLFTKAPTFFTGTITAGAVTLSGVLFQKAPTFPTGVVSTGAFALTGSLFTKAPTFPQGTVTAGAVNLTGVLFQKAPTFPTGAVTAAYTLTGVLFVKAPTFPTGTIGQAGTLFGVLFQKAPTFFTGSLAQGGPSFWQPNPAGWTANPSPFVGVGRYGPSPWGAELSGQRFEKAPTFPVGAVS